MNATVIATPPLPHTRTAHGRSLLNGAAAFRSGLYTSRAIQPSRVGTGSSSAEARSYFQRSAQAQAQADAERELSVQPGKPLVPGRRGNTSEAARILGCSTSLVRWLIRMGELQHVERPGKRTYLLDLDEVHRYRLRKMEERF